MPIDESPLYSISEKHADQFLAVEVESLFLEYLLAQKPVAMAALMNLRLLLNDSWTQDSHAYPGDIYFSL